MNCSIEVIENDCRTGVVIHITVSKSEIVSPWSGGGSATEIDWGEGAGSQLVSGGGVSGSSYGSGGSPVSA